MTETLLEQRRGGVLHLTLNRPDKLNAIDLPLLDALTETLAAAEESREVRAIVLAGAGRSFCAGADIGQMIDRTPAEWERIVSHYLEDRKSVV